MQGNFTAPGPLTEEIADYMVLRAKLNGTGFALPGQGDRWDEGYEVTAALNNKMRYAYSEDYFVQLLGKPVDQLCVLEGFVDISNNLINISAVYLQGMQGNFTAPGPLTEEIADYMVLRAKLNGTGFALPGQGDRWDEGYEVTAALNNKMRYAYSEDYFVQLLGKPVDQLCVLEGFVDISNNLINISAVYLQGMQGDELRTAFTALMYHEMTHVFNGQGTLQPRVH
ncbi:hypothetical protein RJ640_027076 [Escallonia rubra]|uniref:Uncharacterized protein n=1 Tax=Escallonia rubra TaxID=112253 RepID=A0AA88RN78_9ASTE|nr:hypothetical protein RJ640_027076 [Escallonia rubra]